jgi:hypothetical protein
LALLVLLGILFASTVWVAVDMRGLQEKIDQFFEVTVSPPPPKRLRSRYSSEAVAAKRQQLLRKAEGRLFSSTPEAGSDHPSAKAVAAPSLPALLRQAPPLPKPLPALAALEALERQTLNGQVSTSVPVVARRSASRTDRFRQPDLNALYHSGREGGGGPGRPQAGTVPPTFAKQGLPPLPRVKAIAPVPLAPVPAESVRAVAAHSHVLLNATPAATYPSLDRDVTADFAVYRSPTDGERYFRLTLTVKSESPLPAIPKDVFFLLDTSQSVGDEEYAVLREAVLQALKRLQPGDRFNVARFSETTQFLSEGFLPARSVLPRWDELKAFTKRRYDERTTDVFAALNQVLARLPKSGRPTAFFLLSDGKATQGVDDVKTLVKGLNRVNRDSFAIHTFNAGEGGDRYLLMLLSYRSRGFYQESPVLKTAGRELGAFTDVLAQPVLTNVVLSYTNVDPDQVYPGVLPSLYRNHPIVIYGRGSVGKNIVLRVAGFHRGQPREFFFRTTIPEGKTDSPEVAREWAIGKCHALMARLSQDPRDAALRQQIIDLAKTHELPSILEMVERRGILAPLRKLFDRKPEEKK